MRMPNFLKLDTKPFHQETYEGPQDDYEGEERKESAIMLDVTNTIRWRWVQGENGEMVRFYDCFLCHQYIDKSL